MEEENVLIDIIKKFGNGLSGINLLMNGFGSGCLKAIIEGCPKLKTLTLEPFHDPEYTNTIWYVTFLSRIVAAGLPGHVLATMPISFSDLFDDDMVALSEGCKDLKDLKITKGFFPSFTESEIKSILPNCNVEMKECLFDDSQNAHWGRLKINTKEN